MKYWPAVFLATLAGLVGVMDLASALSPPIFIRYRLLHELFPPILLHTSRSLTLIIGIFLLTLAKGLYLRKSRAWLLATALLVITLVLHLLKGLDYEEFVVTTAVLAGFIYFRPLFNIQSDRRIILFTLKKSLFLLIILITYSLLGIYLLRTQFNGNITTSTVVRESIYNTLGLGSDNLVARSRWAHWFENSVNTATLTLYWLVLISLFAPVIDSRKPSSRDYNDMLRLLRSGEHDNFGYFSLTHEKEFWFDYGRSTAIAFFRTGNTIIVLGEGIGTNRYKAINLFKNEYQAKGYHIIHYGVGNNFKKYSGSLRFIQVGEEAVIDLDQFDLSQSRYSDIRHAVAHTTRAGITFAFYQANTVPWQVLQQLAELYAKSLRHKKTKPLGFSMNIYPLIPLPECDILVGYDANKVMCTALTFYPGLKSQKVLDLMIRSDSSPNGAVESALAFACGHYQAKNLGQISLGMAPLASVSQAQDTKLIRSARQLVFDRFNQLYNYKSLYKFKKKFATHWDPKYIGLDRHLSIPTAVAAVIKAHFGS